MSATKGILATIERFNEAFNRHDVEAVMKLMTDDIVFENTSGGRFESQADVRAVLTRAFALMSTVWWQRNSRTESPRTSCKSLGFSSRARQCTRAGLWCFGVVR